MHSKNSKQFSNTLLKYIILLNNSATNIIKKLLTTLELKQSQSLQRKLGIKLIIKITIPTPNQGWGFMKSLIWIIIRNM